MGADDEYFRRMFTRIDNFVGEYDFLDLNYPCNIRFKGHNFPSVAHVIYLLRYVHKIDGVEYHFTLHGGLQETFVNSITALKSEDLNKDLEPNPEWESWRYECLDKILRDKFKRNVELREKLRKTGDRDILYILHDLYLGSDGKNGQNILGRITEGIRADIEQFKDHVVWLSVCNNLCSEPFSIEIEQDDDRFDLTGSNCYDIGRLPSCHIKPLNTSISRIHASVFVDKGANIYIVNYNALTGLKLNNRTLEAHTPKRLHNGDEFTLGTSSRIYKVYIDRDHTRNYLERVEDRRKENVKKASLKAKNLENELKTFLEGSLEVMVSNVSYKTKRAELYDFFGVCGEIDSIKIPQRGRSEEGDDACASRGIAFIKFKTRKAAEAALEKDGTSLNYRKIQVKYATQDSWEATFVRSRERRSRSREYRRSRSTDRKRYRR
ncbi:hypothetical protein BEWA_036920 [Theileria equi strain WA]|uniref:FHA domain-containing protein n=1 Tax=Theileria equi strain WA TaxID=1537102 RepID=L1LE84_THEEQ|nr:hypothetical protein BEWA_036920 [Theileria equi strain WA]EKX73656.1 hypothetical protein BEWA_036920 [Theileria equi strain WA]|eukprot:XP_004833108.1 hypothetical protein BEWA_036920 [Theileria equi strain WA]